MSDEKPVRFKVGTLVDHFENDRDPEYLKVIEVREGPYGQEIRLEGEEELGWCQSENFIRRRRPSPKPEHNRTERQIMKWLREQNHNDLADRIAAGEHKAGGQS